MEHAELKVKRLRKGDIQVDRVCNYEGECPYCDFYVNSDSRSEVIDEIWKHIREGDCPGVDHS